MKSIATAIKLNQKPACINAQGSISNTTTSKTCYFWNTLKGALVKKLSNGLKKFEKSLVDALAAILVLTKFLKAFGPIWPNV